jgi:hypothetical protein
MKQTFNENDSNKNLFILQTKYNNLYNNYSNLLEENYELKNENKKLLEKNQKLISFLKNYGFNEELNCFNKNIDNKTIKYFQKESEHFFKKEVQLIEKINELEKTIKNLKKENNIVNNHIYNVQPNNSNLNIINSNQNKIHRRANSHLSNENSIKSNFLYNNNNNIIFYCNLEREESNQTNKSADEKIEDSSNYNIFDKKNENYIIQFGKNKKDKITSKCLCKKCKNYFIKNEKSNQINYGCYFNFNDINDNLCPNCNKKKNYNKNK